MSPAILTRLRGESLEPVDSVAHLISGVVYEDSVAACGAGSGRDLIWAIYDSGCFLVCPRCLAQDPGAPADRSG